jgi:Cu(I)/Ag(I) efflux system membrane fusion protein
MFTDVELKINLGRKLAVPDEAVIDTGLRQIVYIDKGDGYFEPKAITPGVRAEKLVEVLSGLKAGEKVASSANFLIDSEAKLKGIEAPGKNPVRKQEATPPPVEHKH